MKDLLLYVLADWERERKCQFCGVHQKHPRKQLHQEFCPRFVAWEVGLINIPAFVKVDAFEQKGRLLDGCEVVLKYVSPDKLERYNDYAEAVL